MGARQLFAQCRPAPHDARKGRHYYRRMLRLAKP